MHSAFRNEVKTMDYRTKRKNDVYSAFKDVKYFSTALLEFQEAVREIRYTVDGKISGGKEFAEALKFVVHDQIEASESKTTIKAFEALIKVIDVRIADMTK